MIKHAGIIIFAVALCALGVETIVCAGSTPFDFAGRPAIHVIPLLPPNAVVVYACGALWTLCGIGLLYKRTVTLSALVFAISFVCVTIAGIVPKTVSFPADISIRTVAFEPLTMASLAVLHARGIWNPGGHPQSSRVV